MHASRHIIAFIGLFLSTALISPAQKLSYSHTLSVDPAAAPYLVSLAVPSGAVIANISDVGYHDTTGNRILWGPFDQIGIQELSFDVISQTGTNITARPQIITTGGAADGAAPGAAAGIVNFASWAAGQAPGETSALRKSASFDLNADGIPNLIAYLLDLRMDEPGDLSAAIDLETTAGSGKPLTFAGLSDATDYDLLLREIDLSAGGALIRVINLSKMGGSPQLDGPGEAFFFQLSGEQKNP